MVSKITVAPPLSAGLTTIVVSFFRSFKAFNSDEDRLWYTRGFCKVRTLFVMLPRKRSRNTSLPGRRVGKV